MNTTFSMPKTQALVREYMGEQNGSKEMQARIRETFKEEHVRFFTGKWDVIAYRGKNRWPKWVRKTMANDYANWYNAEVLDMSLEFNFTEKGQSIPQVYIRAWGSNVEGDSFMNLADITFHKPWTSEEGAAYKRGY